MPIAQNKYPSQNHSAFLALAEEVERVKKMEGGTAFIVDLIEAVVESQGLVVVDKAEYESLSPGKVEGWREIGAVKIMRDFIERQSEKLRGMEGSIAWRNGYGAALDNMTSVLTAALPLSQRGEK